MSLASRKKARTQRKTKLRDKVESSKSKTSYNDARLWSCATNKDGIGSATIRFLAPSDKDIEYYVENLDYKEDEVPFYVMQHQHGFKGPNGKWYIENCPTSVVERECPVCEANGEVVDAAGGWDAMDDNHPGKKLVRNRKRKEVYYANILVIEDKANPDNQGEVKIFKYGKAIHDKIMAQLIPEFEDEESVDVSDYWEGSNFKLKITRKDGYANYDKSTWEDASPVADSDDDIQAILDKQFTLSEFIAESKYKSYEELTKSFERTQGDVKPRAPADDAGDDSGEEPEAPAAEAKPAGRRRPQPSKKAADDADEDDAPVSKPTKAAATADDDDDAYFASLLDD